MSMYSFVTHVNEISKQLVQFQLRNDRTPQQKLTDDEIMDILENAMPNVWQEEMWRLIFDCTAKG
eukprot:4534676-Ditylum_brightwellii.AAC.1